MESSENDFDPQTPNPRTKVQTLLALLFVLLGTVSSSNHKITIENVMENDTLSFVPKTILNLPFRSDSIYLIGRQDWPPALKIESDPLFVSRIAKSTPETKFRSFQDSRDQGSGSFSRYHSVTYDLATNGTYIKVKKGGVNFTTYTYDILETVELPSKECNQNIRFLAYYERITNSLQEWVYCEEDGIFLYSEDRQKPTISLLRSSHESPHIILPKNFQKVIYQQGKPLSYIYYKLDLEHVKEAKELDIKNIQLLLVSLNEGNNRPLENLVDLKSALKKQEIDLTVLIDVNIFSTLQFGFYLTSHIQGFIKDKENNIKFALIDCLLSVQTFTIEECQIIHSEDDRPSIYHGELVASDSSEKDETHTNAFEFLMEKKGVDGKNSYKLHLIMYVHIVNTKKIRKIIQLENSMYLDNPSVRAIDQDGKDVKIEVLGKYVRKYSYSNGDSWKFAFYELLFPLANNMYYYDEKYEYWFYSDLDMFVGVNPSDGYLGYFKSSPHRLRVNTEHLPLSEDRAYKTTAFYYNLTSSQNSDFEITMNVLQRKFECSEVRDNNFPLSNTSSTMSVFDVNWLSVSGPLFTLRVKDETSSVKIISPDTSRLQYLIENPSQPGQYSPLEIKWKIATASFVFDMEERITYNCRILANSNMGIMKKVLCKMNNNFSKIIPKLDCLDLLDFSISDQRFAAICLYQNRSKIQYKYHMINFDNGFHESEHYDTKEEFQGGQIVLNDDYCYFFVLDNGTIKGYYRDWRTDKEWNFDLGSNSIISFSAVLLRESFSLSKTDLRLSLVESGKYTSCKLIRGRVVKNTTFPILPSISDKSHSFCSMKYNFLYSQNGKVMIFESSGTETTLFSSNPNYELELILCKDIFTSVVFWRDLKSKKVIYTVVKDQANLSSLRLRRQMTFMGESLPGDLYNSRYFIDEHRVYFTDLEQGPTILNTLLPNTMLYWKTLDKSELAIELVDMFMPENTFEMKVQFSVVNESRKMRFNTLYEAEKNSFGEWSLEYSPLNVIDCAKNAGHFWKVVPTEEFSKTNKVEVTNRFEKYNIDKGIEVQAKYKAYIHTREYDVYMNDSHIVVADPFDPKTRKVLETGLLMDVVDILVAGPGAHGEKCLLVRISSLGVHSLRVVSISESDKIEISESLTGSFDADTEELKAVWVKDQPFVGLTKPLEIDLLQIFSPKCGLDKILEIYSVEFYDLIRIESGDLENRLFVIYGQSKEERIKMKQIDIETCAVVDIDFEEDDDLARFFRKADCMEDANDKTLIHCVLGGFRIFWYEFKHVAENKWSISRKEEYVQYKNFQIQEIKIGLGGSVDFFLLKGERLNQNKYHDGSGVLYYQRNASLSLNHALGGLPTYELVAEGLGQDYTLDISVEEDLVVILDGGESLALYTINEPKLIAHSLVEREKQDIIGVDLYGWDKVPDVMLDQVPPKPPAKKQSSLPRYMVFIIVCGLVGVGVLVVFLLIFCAKKQIRAEVEPEEYKDYSNSSFGPGSLSKISRSISNQSTYSKPGNKL